MHFAHFSALLLAGTVAATPRQHHGKGKWEHFHHHSSFPTLGDVSTGFIMPYGTGTALAARPTAVGSGMPSVPSIESGGDGIEKEGTKPEKNPGLPSSSAPARVVSSSPAASVGNPAPSAPASAPPSTSSTSSSSSGGVSYSATFTE